MCVLGVTWIKLICLHTVDRCNGVFSKLEKPASFCWGTGSSQARSESAWAKCLQEQRTLYLRHLPIFCPINNSNWLHMRKYTINYYTEKEERSCASLCVNTTGQYWSIDFRPGFVGQRHNRFPLPQDSNVPTMHLTTPHFKTDMGASTLTLTKREKMEKRQLRQAESSNDSRSVLCAVLHRAC